MNIFKKLFGKKKEEEKKQEYWFNSSHLYANGMTETPEEGLALYGLHDYVASAEYTMVNIIAMH